MPLPLWLPAVHLFSTQMKTTNNQPSLQPSATFKWSLLVSLENNLLSFSHWDKLIKVKWHNLTPLIILFVAWIWLGLDHILFDLTLGLVSDINGILIPFFCNAFLPGFFFEPMWVCLCFFLLLQGNVLKTRGGGQAVQFTDIETLTQDCPRYCIYPNTLWCIASTALYVFIHKLVTGKKKV